MLKKLFNLLLFILFVGAILYLGRTDYNKFATDIDLKNPATILQPIIPEITIEKDKDYKIEGKENLTLNIEEIKPEEHQSIDTTNSSQEEDDRDQHSTNTLTAKDIENLIANIEITKKENVPDYNRDDYEKPAVRYEYNGKKISRRNYFTYISANLLDKDNFKYLDPYTNIKINDISKIDWDHIFPLKLAHESGAWKWDNKKKNEFAYDIMVGVPVLNTENRRKGAKGPADYLPEVNKDKYCYSFFLIADKYDLSMRQKDINVCKLELLNSISSGNEITPINIFKER